jgi:hypothetical protein
VDGGFFFRERAHARLNTNAEAAGIPGVRVQRRRKNLIKDYIDWPWMPVTELTISKTILVEICRNG